VDILRHVPLGIYLESPYTWIHRLDPRLKLGWLLSILLSPILATNIWRILVVVGLILLTLLSQIPFRVWSRQLALVLFFGGITFVLTSATPDGLGIASQVQRQEAAVVGYGLSGSQDPYFQSLQHSWIPSPPPTEYRYELGSTPKNWIIGPFIVTRRSFSLAVRVSTLIFTLLYSTNLFLLTTPPEEIAEALERLLRPLKSLKVPVSEIILTLTLALRFLPLVLEEVQNLLQAVRTRDIRWQTLKLRGAIHTGLALVERLLENILLRAEQTAIAMQARGYAGPHQSVRWHVFRFGIVDWILLGSLLGFWGVRLWLFSA
jgi:energy-coupling factor transport system permease protein